MSSPQPPQLHEMNRTTTISLTVNNIQQHLKFLNDVRKISSLVKVQQEVPATSKLSKPKPTTEPAITTTFFPLTAETIDRYQNQWLPLVAKHPNEELIPPIDVAWVWHVHRLAPIVYSKYSKKRFNKNLNNKDFAYQHKGQEQEPGDTTTLAAEHTRKLWHNHTNGAPFFVTRTYHLNNHDEQQPVFFVGNYDLCGASQRQLSFITSVSAPLYKSKQFLSTCIEQYSQFLLIVKHNRQQKKTPAIPSVAIDVAWHTHQLLNTSTYLAETCKFSREKHSYSTIRCSCLKKSNMHITILLSKSLTLYLFILSLFLSLIVLHALRVLSRFALSQQTY
jgi:hypothetical protein